MFCALTSPSVHRMHCNTSCFETTSQTCADIVQWKMMARDVRWSFSQLVSQLVSQSVGHSVGQSDGLSCHDPKLTPPAVPQHVLYAHGEVSRMAPDEPTVRLKLKFKLRHIYTINPGAVQTPLDPLPPSSNTSTNPTLLWKPCLPLNSTMPLPSRSRFNSCRHSCKPPWLPCYLTT